MSVNRHATTTPVRDPGLPVHGAITAALVSAVLLLERIIGLRAYVRL